ncbi:MAG: hypothetical protein AAF191_02865 [Verrucomicrobiota bacterium]
MTSCPAPETLSSLRRGKSIPFPRLLRIAALLTMACAVSQCTTAPSNSLAPSPFQQQEPSLLLGSSEKEVRHRLRHLNGKEEKADTAGERVWTAHYQGRTLTAVVTNGVCQSLTLHGRFEQSRFPKTPADLAQLRDAYSGHLDWEPASPGPFVNPASLQGKRIWVSEKKDRSALSSWEYENPEKTAGTYELTLRQI